jgi:hypothetical protein
MSTAPVVTICGSMRFYDQMLTVAADETRAGNIVLMPFAVVAPDDQDTDLKSMLDRLHREKLDLSCRVIVVSDQSGYYGVSTASEIDYAELLGTPVTYWRVTSGSALHTVPCGWGCGFLATSEDELNEHEPACEHQPRDGGPVLVMRDETADLFRCCSTAPSRTVRSLLRHGRRVGGEQR